VLRPAAVLFDVGDTLLKEARFDLEAGIRAVLPNEETLVSELARDFRIQIQRLHACRRDILLSTWLRENVPALAAHSDESVENAVWSAVVTLLPMRGVAAVLNRLRQDGIAMAAVSNASFSGRILFRELARHGLAEALSFVLSSGEVGVRKPAPEIFHEAVSRLGKPAQSTWYVGDTFGEDVEGALCVELVPIWLHHGPAPSSLVRSVNVVRDWAEFIDLYDASH
jgi:HAD superfamily hydrolase (TIGR01549 family)